MTRPESICNGCGQRKPTSKEHLVHVAVARVLLRNRAIKTGKDRDAALRAHPFFSGLELYRDPLRSDPERPIFLTVYVENLICKECNQTWARELEEEAGDALYQFIHLHRPAQAVLRKWSFYFAVKLWWAQRRAEALRWGDSCRYYGRSAGALAWGPRSGLPKYVAPTGSSQACREDGQAIHPTSRSSSGESCS